MLSSTIIQLLVSTGSYSLCPGPFWTPHISTAQKASARLPKFSRILELALLCGGIDAPGAFLNANKFWWRPRYFFDNASFLRDPLESLHRSDLTWPWTQPRRLVQTGFPQLGVPWLHVAHDFECGPQASVPHHSHASLTLEQSHLSCLSLAVDASGCRIRWQLHVNQSVG